MSGRTIDKHAPRKLWRVIAIGVSAAILVTIAAVAVAYSPARAGGTASAEALTEADQAAITGLLTEYKTGVAQGYIVPVEALASVKERQRAVAEAGAAAVAEGESHAPVLPADVKRAMTSASSRTIQEYCTETYAAALLKEPMGEGTDLSLFNSPTAPPIVGSEFDVLAVKYEGAVDDDVVVWAVMWNGDATESGPSRESWSVREFRLTHAGTRWHIAGETLLWHWDDASTKEWGPSSPHEDWASGEMLGGSELFTDEELPIREIESLGNLADEGR